MPFSKTFTVVTHCIAGLIGFLLFISPAFAQDLSRSPNNQDCLGAIPVCQPIYSTIASYIGCGNVCPEIHNNSVCPLCMDGEINDVFYIITVQTDGILRFTLTPNNSSNDYDWSVFNMTESDCSQLYPNAVELQVSCNSYGVLGYNGPTGINTAQSDNTDCNGPGTTNGPAFNKDLDVLAGETYLINISNWSSSNQQGYLLDFSGSTSTIYDDIPPVIDSIQQEVPCNGTTQLYFRFSENVMCDDVFHHEENFSLTGPGGTITITDVLSEDCGTGASQSPFFYLQLDTAVNTGSYTLSIIGDIRDLCSNIALYESYPFEISQLNAPVAGAGNDTTVFNGAVITLNGSGTNGTPPLSFHWEPANLLINPNVEDPTTVPMGGSTEFTVTVTDGLNCYDEDDVLVTVLGGPLGVTATATPGTICLGESVQLNAIGSGGSGDYTYSWSSDPPGFSSTLPDPVVFPIVNTTYTVEIADGFSTNSGSTSVTVNPLPLADAGPDISIPFGTNTTLTGTASGGSGSYSWWWTSTPPGFSSTQQNPVTNNLEETTIFTLIVTDQITGCESIQDEVLVTVTGSQLVVNPIAFPPIICQGSSVQLLPMTGGGTGNYTYLWTSLPVGFNSTEASPVISPMQTTSYFLTVSDGYNQASGSVNVIVNPVPQIHLGPADTNVCIYDTVLLDAGNPGSTYYWSNGATSSTIQVGSAGIGYEVQTYSVNVINEYGCIDSASINVIFSFAACTGIDETIMGMDLMLFPNPTSGELTLSLKPVKERIVFSFMTLYGQEVIREVIDPGHISIFEKRYNFSRLPKGIYLVEITGEHQSVIRKIILK